MKEAYQVALAGLVVEAVVLFGAEDFDAAVEVEAFFVAEGRGGSGLVGESEETDAQVVLEVPVCLVVESQDDVLA